MTSKVNLDALIPREDFEMIDSQFSGIRSKDTLSINDLRKGEFFFSALRKPDFQRETNEWDPKKIAALINSFLNEDLIPAVILWRSQGSYIFVIDGSHRLSALAAWVNDDYGDGEISKQFYETTIPEDQVEIAIETRNLVRKTIGSFADHQLAIQNPNKVSDDIARRAKSLGALTIQLQWVQGDASKAESSFFRINQQASPINATELRVLQARKKPSGIAARAIIRSGKGHKYWSAFEEETQRAIQDYARDINNLLFVPRLDNPVKTLDLPLGGPQGAANVLSLILDFVNIVNNVHISQEGRKAKGTEAPNEVEDTDGHATLQYLARCKVVLQRMNSTYAGSLGIHPVIYLYSSNGRYKYASFFALTELMIEFEKRNYYKRFTEVRAKFEELIIEYDYLVQQIVRKHRSAIASYKSVAQFYMLCLERLREGKTFDEVVNTVVADPNFSYLTHSTYMEDEVTSEDFSRERKSEAFIREALKGAPKCAICGGYIHKNAMTIDHIKRKEDGGIGSSNNAQLAHPYCNTGYKN